jgi:hypothetical protein
MVRGGFPVFYVEKFEILFKTFCAEVSSAVGNDHRWTPEFHHNFAINKSCNFFGGGRFQWGDDCPASGVFDRGYDPSM